MKKILLFCVAAVLLQARLAYSDAGEKQSWDDMPLEDKFFHKAQFIVMNAGRANLSDERTQNISDLKYQIRKEVIRMNADIEILSMEIWQKIYEKPVDMAEINDLINQKYALKKELARTLIAAYVELINIPTADEWRELKKNW